MLKKLKNRNEGFTIIEVLIVLAIAGLILLVVFLAVPALQRNSRNTQRRSDVSRVLGSAQEVLNNNNGALASLTAANVATAAGNLAYYPAGFLAVSGPPASPVNTNTVDNVTIYTGATCASGQATTTGATARQIAITYMVEPAVTQCTNS